MNSAPLILSAEDDFDIRTLLQMALEWGGYRVVVAADGQAALDAIRGETPALFLIDLNMPKLSGLEVVRRLRDEDRFRDTPIVVLTASESEAREVEAADAGVTRYVLKPIAPGALIALVDELLGRSR